MTEIHAKPIIDGKFWVVEQDGQNIATLEKKEDNRYVLNDFHGELIFNKKEELTKKFGQSFFISKTKVKITKMVDKECHGYPTSYIPYNSMYDVRRRLPLFTKSEHSKSLYCAGYYAIKFNLNWVKSFCPKIITIERYPYKGPFKTELELRTVLNNAKSD